jgi:hypothetical protein
MPVWHVIRKHADDEHSGDERKQRGELRVRVFLSRLQPKTAGLKVPPPAADHALPADSPTDPARAQPIAAETSSLVADVIRGKVSKKKRRFQK